MEIFTKLYDMTLRLSRHKHAPFYLGGITFMEASLFPIPPDVMLAPMSLANPHRAWWYATLTTLASTLGALFAYMLGMFFAHWIIPLLIEFGYEAQYEQVQAWFIRWGVWVVFLAGFSPMPFKLFAIGAGVLSMPLLPFVIAVLIGRGLRFYLVAGLMYWGGAPMEKFLRRIVEWLGWCFVVVVITGYTVYYFMR